MVYAMGGLSNYVALAQTLLLCRNMQTNTLDPRAQAIVDSLAGFCHAIGQPATVLLSSVEFLRMGVGDAAVRKEVLDASFDAVLEIRGLLAEMKNRREYLAEAYLGSTDLGGTIAAMPEWSERMPLPPHKSK